MLQRNRPQPFFEEEFTEGDIAEPWLAMLKDDVKDRTCTSGIIIGEVLPGYSGTKVALVSLST
jgi:hypothetical protein